MTPAERDTLDLFLMELREEAVECARVQNRTTERAEVLCEVANRLEQAFSAGPGPVVGDVAGDE